MSRYYRYRLPCWARNWLITCEKCMLPIVIFQLIRTLLIPTTFDVLLLGVLIGILLAFQFKWI